MRVGSDQGNIWHGIAPWLLLLVGWFVRWFLDWEIDGTVLLAAAAIVLAVQNK